jgi:hypothetical protein
VSHKLELLVDLDNPIEEIKGCILAIVTAHPNKQLEILNQLDMWMGETVSSIEQAVQVKEQSEQEE